MPNTPSAPQPLEAANRTAKVRRFVNFLDDNATEFVASVTLEQLTAAQWLRIAEMAGENMPSEMTIAAIVAYVRAREDGAAKAPVDLFGGPS